MADAVRAYLAQRNLLPGEQPPTLPGTEWRPASEDHGGGWNLWEILQDNDEAKKTRYRGWLTAEEWDAIQQEFAPQAVAPQGASSARNTLAPQGANAGSKPPAPQGAKPRKRRVAPWGARNAKSQKNNVFKFPAPQGAKDTGEAGEQHIKALLPGVKSGQGWWVVDADGTGFKIKFRRRLKPGETGKPTCVFRRLGKIEYQRLREKPYEFQIAAIDKRIFTELFRQRRLDVASRLLGRAGNDAGINEPARAQAG